MPFDWLITNLGTVTSVTVKQEETTGSAYLQVNYIFKESVVIFS